MASRQALAYLTDDTTIRRLGCDFHIRAGFASSPFVSLRIFTRGLIVRRCTRMEKITTPNVRFKIARDRETRCSNLERVRAPVLREARPIQLHAANEAESCLRRGCSEERADKRTAHALQARDR